MFILHVEHRVASYEGWRKAFGADPLDRKKSGVRSYRISRPPEDSSYVAVDIEFATLAEAEDTLARLRLMWQQIEGKILTNPKARIFRVDESRTV